MQLACISISNLPFRVESACNPRLRGRPVVIVTTTGQRRTVLDASPLAKGVVPGMSLAQALSSCKDAVLVEGDPKSYNRAFEQVLDALEARGADVEDAGLGLAFARLNGLAPMFGGEARLITSLLQAVPASLEPQLGVADGKFAAYVAASMAPPGSAYKLPGDLAEFLAPLSVDLLPASWEVKRRLHSFGLHTLGQVGNVMLGPLQAQFGPTGKLIWELSQGIDPRLLIPPHHEEIVEEALTFTTPLVALEAIAMATDNLLARAFSRPSVRGRFARVCTLEGSVFRAPSWQKVMVFREPVGERRKALTLITHTLEGSPPPGPLEDLHLTLSGLTGEAGRQESLFPEARQQDNLREALAQLQVRLGAEELPIYQVREVEPWSRIPERRQALVPYAL